MPCRLPGSQSLHKYESHKYQVDHVGPKEMNFEEGCRCLHDTVCLFSCVEGRYRRSQFVVCNQLCVYVIRFVNLWSKDILAHS